MEHLPQRAKEDLLAGAHVCRHSDGGGGAGTAVPADPFGEQTYIKRRKGSGGMKDISTSPQHVAVRVNSFSVCAHLDIAMEHMCGLIVSVCAPTLTSPWNTCTMKLGRSRSLRGGACSAFQRAVSVKLCTLFVPVSWEIT